MLYGQITNGTVYLTNDKTGMAVYESLVDGNELEPGTFGSDSAWSQVTA